MWVHIHTDPLYSSMWEPYYGSARSLTLYCHYVALLNTTHWSASVLLLWSRIDHLHRGRLVRFVRDTLLSEARWVHGRDLASTYVLHLLWCSVPVFRREGRTEVQRGGGGTRVRDVTWYDITWFYLVWLMCDLTWFQTGELEYRIWAFIQKDKNNGAWTRGRASGMRTNYGETRV